MGDSSLRGGAARVLRRAQVAGFLRDEVESGFAAVVRRPVGQRVVALPVSVLRGR